MWEFAVFLTLVPTNWQFCKTKCKIQAVSQAEGQHDYEFNNMFYVKVPVLLITGIIRRTGRLGEDWRYRNLPFEGIKKAPAYRESLNLFDKLISY